MAASWIDLSSEINFESCFAFDIGEGHLSGVIDECAIVQTERRMAAPSSATPEPIEDEIWKTSNSEVRNLLSKLLNPSGILVKLETAIIGAGGDPYRLLSMVKTAKIRRIIDPCDTLVALLRSEFLQCKQHCNSNVFREEPKILLWAFDEALGFWEDTNNPQKGDAMQSARPIWMVDVGTKHLALNVAMSLSPHGCVVQEGNMHDSCAIKASATDTSGRILQARRVLRRAEDSDQKS